MKKDITSYSESKPLHSVQVAMPLEALVNCYPQIGKDLANKLGSSLNVMHINKFLSESSIECTYINIFVNNAAVCAIVDSGAPFNIVTT